MKDYFNRKALTLLLATTVFTGVWAQTESIEEKTRAIEFPDIPGYLTLKCDLHMHTVLSDGNVWPSIRVQEAVKDGLDAISITDHIEYQPHATDIPHPDRNRSYELALRAARGTDLMIIPGTEITRSMPPGHLNAIFVKDVNLLMDEDVVKVLEEAKKQNAFVFWNHPHWTAQRKDGVATLTEMHLKLLEKGLFSGIEIYNETTYSEEALEIAHEHKLTILGTTDVHGLVDWTYDPGQGKHRPVTLVFAKEKTPEAMQEAMSERRTAVWFDNTLIGKQEFLSPLIESSLEVSLTKEGLVPHVRIYNHSDADYILLNNSEYTLHNSASILTIKAHEATTVMVKTLEKLESFDLKFSVLNAFTAPDEHPEISLEVRK